ncbi:MAG: hypothetical protein IJ751_05185 [Oscillospiraceae bacterium]|nr:hypothetical protein [Oscillospiraceae bacterium]
MNRLTLEPERRGASIAPELHSQFIEELGRCIRGGVWVGEDSEIANIHGIRADVVNALKALAPPLIRWPGGCYADTYHWRDGIGPRDQRPVTFNENFGTYERDDHQFGTHEFMELCRLVGARPWINVNLVSGTVQEMKDWMEYCNRADDTDLARERAANGSPEPFHVEYWGIGNEPWCGGGYYTARGYTDTYRKYAMAAPNFHHALSDPDAPPMRMIIAGADGNKPKERVAWTTDVFRHLGEYRQPPVYGMDLHFYNWNLARQDETETDFTKEDWDRVIDSCFELEEVIHEQYQLIRSGVEAMPATQFGPPVDCKLMVGEWGNWHGCAFAAPTALFQQVSMRDAVTSALTLDIFHRCSDEVSAACVAQTVNVLNALFLTDGPRFLKTPNYDVFEMYLPHRGGTVIGCTPSEGCPASLHTFASEKDGVITVNLVNASYDESESLSISVPEGWRCIGARVLCSTHPQDCNTWEEPDLIRARDADGVAPVPGGCTALLPAASVTVVQFARA